MFRLCCLAVVLLQDQRFILGDMELSVLEPKLFSTIECVSPNDITITFLNT
ncbi:hypothetical protein DPMN_067816 [Dreissena polymorpha]|uniref:Uncharacterized protein n=1 Tax=Dreissena polymorpha TaxID=45954 RepID=A0A9D3YY00_DREPO|nr:hypothetical protein DPMN_067816 [Dreissena polymorpha]